MPRIKLIVEYDGTNYVGWQIQQNGASVQGRLQRALAELLGEPVEVMAAGRTDSGVHALGQVACFDTARALPLKAYWMGLNGILPEDISVVRAEEVSARFDPRRWSQGKRYRYLISNRRSRSPMRRHTHWEIFQRLDMAAMAEGAGALVGKHDFSAFRASDCQAAHALREVRKLKVTGEPGEAITIEVEGTAVLKHMVRNFAGSRVAVGRGRQRPEGGTQTLGGRDRTRAGPTAPAHGLTLVEVFYGDGPPGERPDPEDQ
ncbi:MAG: tRNA pseudouridine(38-40) synthase TruA [Myxococcaceae bacterium]